MGQATGRTREGLCLGMGAIAAALLVVGVPGCGARFSSAAAGGGGQGGSTTGTTSHGGAGGEAGSAAGATGGGGGGGGGGGCAQDLCQPGEPLAADCSLCVSQVCGHHPECCDGGTGWSLDCVYAAALLCDATCPAVSCEDQYDTSNLGRQLCAQAPPACIVEMGATLSCDTFCRIHKGECLAAYASEEAACAEGAPINCDVVGTTAATICHCSLGCGLGAPCQGTDVCDAGSCEAPL